MGILGFVEGTVEAIPTGKQNSFAANNLPAYIMLTIAKAATPVSLANAFEKPVMPDYKLSLSEKSTKSLLAYFEQMKTLYDLKFDKEIEFGIKVDKENNSSAIGNYKTFITELESYLNNNL